MNDLALLDMWHEALRTAALVSAPFLGGALAIGLLMSLLQAATQMQESAIAFVPKLVGILVILSLCGSWALDELTRSCGAALSLGTAAAHPREGRR